MTVKELTIVAKELGICGYSGMRKAELEQVVSEKQREMAELEHKELHDKLAREAQEFKAKGGEQKGLQKRTKEEASRLLSEMTKELPIVEEAKPKEEKAMKTTRPATPKIIFRHVPTQTVKVKGIRILWGQSGEDNISILRNDTFDIPTGNIWADAAIAGTLTPVAMDINDPAIRTDVLQHAMETLRVKTLEKYGESKILIGKKADSSKAIFFLGFLKDITDILGVNPSYKTPISKVTLPTFSNRILEVVSSDIQEIKLRIVDPKIHHGGHNTNDGSCYIDNVRAYYQSYVSTVAKEKFGKKSELLILRDAQLRFTCTISKLCASMDTFAGKAKEFCEANGLTLDGCHGAIDVECLKGNIDGVNVKYRHGDILTVPIEDFRVINISSPEGSSRCGVQLTCSDDTAAALLLDEARPEHKELGLAEKGRIFKEACAGKATALAEIIKATYSFHDSFMQEVKTLLFAIPKDSNRKVVDCNSEEADWYAPEFQSNHHQLNGRRLAYIQGHLYKTKTSNTNHYFAAHPSALLDRYEEEYFAKTGKVVNYAIAPFDQDFKKQADEFFYAAIGRAPQQYQGSIQEVLYLREDVDGNVILNPEMLRNKEGNLMMRGGSITVSYGFVSCLQGDFDGDIATEIFSNVAQFPMWRPEEKKDIWSKVNPEEEKPVSYITDIEKYIEEQKRDYKNIIWSQVAIGMFDNFARLLYTMRRETKGKSIKINGVSRVGQPIPTIIGKKISDQREDTIKAKKWDIDVAAIQNTCEDFTRWYAPNGQLPKGDKRPASFLLLHNSLGAEKFLDSTTMMKRFISLIERINSDNEIHELDCYKTLWKALKGIKVHECHNDSQYWRNAIYKMLSNYSNLFEGITISPNTKSRIEWFATYLTGTGELNGADKEGNTYEDDLRTRFEKEMEKEIKFSGYRYWSSRLIEEADDAAREELYKRLFDRVSEAREAFLDQIAEGDKDKRSVISKLLTLAVGNISFGVGINRQTQKHYSLPGYTFWNMPMEDLVWIVKQVHPNNPFISKYEEKKAKEEERMQKYGTIK